MSRLQEIFQSLNITSEQAQKLITAVKENPLSAMGLIQEMGIDPTAIQTIAMELMSNPDAMKEVMAEMGVSDQDVEKAKEQLGK